MEKVTAYVREDDTATIVCPACKRPKTTSVASFRNKSHDLKVKCPCGTQFMVHLNFRQFYRKPTDLEGMYKSINPRGHGGGRITIQNISKGGLGFTVDGMNTIEKGHLLEVSFTLDDKKRTALKKEVVVQSVSEDFVGCRFRSDKAYEKELGFYLQR